MEKLNKLLIVLFIFTLNSTVYAQDPDDPGTDPGMLSISDYIPFIIVVALVLAYVLMHKKKRVG